VRSILLAVVIAFSTVSLAYADDVSGKASAADQKEACKTAQKQARGASRKNIDFEPCQCTQANGQFTCTVKGAAR
jgi:hypothetical protein